MADERLSPKDYQDAIYAQDACNLSGVVHSFSRVVNKIWAEARTLGKGTEWVNTHPISILYASKVGSLANSEDLQSYSEAYDACQREAQELCA